MVSVTFSSRFLRGRWACAQRILKVRRAGGGGDGDIGGIGVEPFFLFPVLDFLGGGVADFDFETPAAFSGEVCVVVGANPCFLGVGVGACLASIEEFAGSTGVDVNGFISLVCVLLADDDDDDGVCFGVLRIPPFRDGDLKVEALAASC